MNNQQQEAEFGEFWTEIENALNGVSAPTKLERTLTEFDAFEYGEKLFLNIPEMKLVGSLLATNIQDESSAMDQIRNTCRMMARHMVRELIAQHHHMLISGAMKGEYQVRLLADFRACC